VISFLCSESGSHDYSIYRKEAKDELGLAVETPNEELYALIKNIYDDVAGELQLTEPFDPKVLLAGQQSATYHVPRVLIESINGGTHCYSTQGVVTRHRIQH